MGERQQERSKERTWALYINVISVPPPGKTTRVRGRNRYRLLGNIGDGTYGRPPAPCRPEAEAQAHNGGTGGLIATTPLTMIESREGVQGCARWRRMTWRCPMLLV
jgi:hypothetical protein